jgi:hypothetical protein
LNEEVQREREQRAPGETQDDGDRERAAIEHCFRQPPTDVAPDEHPCEHDGDEIEMQEVTDNDN